MGARALLKGSFVRSSSSLIFRSMHRELSSSSTSDLAVPFQQRALLVCGSAEVAPRGAHFPVAEHSRTKSTNFSQDGRRWGSSAAALTRSKVNAVGPKKSTWTCPKCSAVNGVHHQRCMGCEEPDVSAIGRSASLGFSLGVDLPKKVGLPRSIVKFCVNRSPHIDKKSREQFEMRISKLYMVVKTSSEDLQKKLFWLKRQRILGAQYEIVFSYKTRLPLLNNP